MSAKVYPPQTYAPPPIRARKPFHPASTNYPVPEQVAVKATVTPLLPAAAVTPTKKNHPNGENQNANNKSPLTRTTTKALPPSPPKIINDVDSRNHYTRVGFLGEGGFARVYEVVDNTTRTRVACKVISKASLKTKKAKTKLFAEIKIHGMLAHPNIVQFHHCFQDSSNVYMTLSLCNSGSLMDLLRRRRYFSEPEVRYYMLQLISACIYMHTKHAVIHRDLKLGNLFLDENMDLKVGDFGLAALIEREGERKKTICGTPNYIAPEVLFDTANGHSFEVDTWSMGVILYTLLVGRPPFQTKEVKEIYKRIQQNHYTFPSSTVPTPHAQQLITTILTPNPSARPALYDVIDDPWFSKAPMPLGIPVEAYSGEPDFSAIGRRESARNVRELKARLGLNQLPEEEEEEVDDAPTISGLTTLAAALEDEEKQFAKAVQPGSPISMLLNEARKPLTRSPGPKGASGPGMFGMTPMATTSSNKEGGSNNLYKRLVKAKSGTSPLKHVVATTDTGTAGSQPHLGDGEEHNPKHRKELESQKARIVFQMVREEEEELGEPAEPSPPIPKAPAIMGAMKKSAVSRGIENQIPGGPIRVGTEHLGKERKEKERAKEEKEQFGQGMLRRTGEGKKLGVQTHHQKGMMAPPNAFHPPAPSSTGTSLAPPPKEGERQKSRAGSTLSAASGFGGGVVQKARAGGSTLAIPQERARPTSVTTQSNLRDSRAAKTSSTNEDRQRVAAAGWDGEEKFRLPDKIPLSTNVLPASSSSKGEWPTHLAHCPSSILPTGATGFVAAAQVQWTAWDDKAKGKVMRDPRHNARSSTGRWYDVAEENVYIVSWVDFCNKYGMGYALTDGTIGVHFNDSTTMLLSPDQIHFDYIVPLTMGDACGDTQYRRSCYSTEKYPEEIQGKLYLLKHFENYIMGRLWGEHDFTFNRSKQELDELHHCVHIPRTTATPHHQKGPDGRRGEGRGLEWVMNYLRMRHAIVFRLSHDVLQFNFHDHSKVILSQASLRITYIDKKYYLSSWTLQEIVRFSLGDDMRVYTDAERKLLSRLTEKLTYCKEVLMSIYKASGSSGKGKGKEQVNDFGAAGVQKF